MLWRYLGIGGAAHWMIHCEFLLNTRRAVLASFGDLSIGWFRGAGLGVSIYMGRLVRYHIALLIYESGSPHIG